MTKRAQFIWNSHDKEKWLDNRKETWWKTISIECEIKTLHVNYRPCYTVARVLAHTRQFTCNLFIFALVNLDRILQWLVHLYLWCVDQTRVNSLKSSTLSRLDFLKLYRDLRFSPFLTVLVLDWNGKPDSLSRYVSLILRITMPILRKMREKS